MNKQQLKQFLKDSLRIKIQIWPMSKRLDVLLYFEEKDNCTNPDIISVSSINVESYYK